MKTNDVSGSEAVIAIDGLTRHFGPKAALDKVSVTVPRGIVFGLVGANGAGKTTLIKHVLGLLKAEVGSVRVFGRDPVADPAGVLWTWKRMVDSLFLGLTGRKWVIQGSLFAGMFAVAGLVAVVAWVINHPATHETALALLPWLLGLGIFCRFMATAWAIAQLRRQNLVSAGMMLSWSIVWLLVASALVGMLAWAVPRELVPFQYLAYAVVFVLPLAHLAATPLALAWNRHR